jgi:molybdopterin-containing oxidoreductase family membrane subunit
MVCLLAVPYPSTMGINRSFRSPLVWDVFAVSTYFTVSLLFWFLGLIPDLATLRDRATRRVPRFIYGMLAMGWRGSGGSTGIATRCAYLLVGRSGDTARGLGSHGGEF